MGNGDFFFAQIGGCGNNSLEASYSYPQSFWDNIWISEGSVLMSTTGPNEGLITKTFNLKTGTSGDRVGFFVQAKNNVEATSVDPSSVVCNNCNVADYTVIGSSGNDATCESGATTTDGTNEADTGDNESEENNDADTTDNNADTGDNDADTGDNDADTGDNDADTGDDTTTGISAFNQIQLDAHNEYRALHGVPALEYDQDLADAAQAWSENLANIGQLVHATGTG
jgi:hypothetical protein